MGARLVGDDVGRRSPARAAAGAASAALPTHADRQRAAARRVAAIAAGDRVVEDVGAPRRGSGSRAAARCGRASTSMHSATPSFIVTASGCAPPMPPRPAVSVIVPASDAAEAAAGDLGEALVGALQDPLGADVDPRAGGHLPVHREAERLEAAELVPGRPLRAPGWSWRSAPAAPTRGCGTRRRACPTARAASRRRPSVVQRAARWRRRRPTSAPPGRCRRRRRGRRAARPPRGRGCSCSIRSAASCGQPRQRQLACPAARAPVVAPAVIASPVISPRSPHRAVPIADSTASSDRRRTHQRPRRAPSSGDSQRSGPGPATRRRAARASAAPVPAAGGERRAAGRGRAPRTPARRPGCGRRLATTRRSLRAAAQPIDTWSSCIALVGSESTLAGDRQAAVLGDHRGLRVVGDHQPGVDAGVGGEERRQAVRAGAVEQPVGAALGDRADVGDGDGEEVAGEAERGAVEVAARLDPAVGQDHRVVDRRRRARARRSCAAWARVSRAAPCTCGVQRSE